MSKEPEAGLSCGLSHWATLNNKMIRCHQEIQKLLGSPGKKARLPCIGEGAMLVT